jgi:FtsP/CotA-like multicopper oxidase with cupredoxin domain
MYLTEKASKRRLKDAENARNNRLEIVKALSHGQIDRRDLIRWGLVTTGGALMPIGGLSPFVSSAHAATGGVVTNIPTGAPPSPGLAGLEFTQAMPRLQVQDRVPLTQVPGVNQLTGAAEIDIAGLNGPNASRLANQTLQAVPDVLGGGYGPVEGRPGGEGWSHQRWNEFLPQVGVNVSQEGAKANGTTPFRFHPSLATQDPSKVWTFNGTMPPALVIGRYGEPLLVRHSNKLPSDVTANGGFGRHTISTHEHNGHHGAENDGFTGAFFFPGQFYDYHWPILHAGHDSMNTAATDPRCGSPNDAGGITKLAGDWHETMSTHWFHDHMFSFTSQNVYKGNAGMFNIYSSLDRGDESINDGVNLQLPSGSKNGKGWANLDYDVNLLLSEKAFDASGQMYFDIFDLSGFIGDVMTVNFAYKPFFEVEARKYRFRILNASVSRFFKVALSDGSPMIQIGNDGNLLPAPVVLTQLDEQGIAERYDIVIDFSRYTPGQKVWMVNLCQHADGKMPSGDVSIAQALAGTIDPVVGKFLEFRVIPTTGPDLSKVPAVLIPNPDLSRIPVVRQRTFTFGRTDNTDAAPWTVRTNNGFGFAADFGRLSAQPKPGTREVWTLQNGGAGWDHPIHIHFEEGQILARNGSIANVPQAERGRKDVYRLRPGGTVTITMQFREFMGTYMEHCHNTVHEDNAMLVRWDINGGLVPFPTPNPTPQGVEFLPTVKDPTA